jgi:hypothetical protein
MTDAPEYVRRMCDEFGVTIVPRHKYPAPGETRAVATIDRIWRKYGEEHLRLVLTTLVETANNKILLDEIGLWMASDMVRKCQPIIEERAGERLELWDAMPAGDLQFVSQELRGHVSQRAALGGMIYERIYRRFGPFADQLNLFDDLRPK